MSDETPRSSLASALVQGLQFLATAASVAIIATLVAKTLEGPQDTGNANVSDEKMRIAKALWYQRYNGQIPFPTLSTYEYIVLQDMVFPDEIDSNFDSIGGLTNIKNDLIETVLFPLANPQFFATGNALASPLNLLPKGVLLYGPPGSGKTLIAKAVAKQGNITFLNVNLGNLISKYYGESEKLINSLFSVARKFAPSIIFIDEVDTFLGARNNSSKEQESRMISSFLSNWDGLVSSGQGQVLVLGATNRPQSIDEAVLRRFSSQILFDLPQLEDRLEILRVILRDIEIQDSDDTLAFVAEHTVGYSGSDLLEVVKVARMQSVREQIARLHRSNQQQQQQQQQNLGQSQQSSATTFSMVQQQQMRPRATTKDDFIHALGEIQPSGAKAMSYLRSFYHNSGLPTRFVQQLNNPQQQQQQQPQPPVLVPVPPTQQQPQPTATGKKTGGKKTTRAATTQITTPQPEPSQPEPTPASTSKKEEDKPHSIHEVNLHESSAGNDDKTDETADVYFETSE